MQGKLKHIIETIAKKNILHGKKILKLLENADNNYIIKAEAFLNRYEFLLHKNNTSLCYAIDCYLQMLADVNYETVQFIQTGHYSNTTFEDVNKRVYNNPEIMTAYLHGLILRQFLFPQNFKILTFFNKIIKDNRKVISNYLEIGGGHGLFLSDAISVLNHNTQFKLLDISQSALDFSRDFIDNEKVTYILSDIFQFKSFELFNFISMGEVLEHVEEPIKLLKTLKHLLHKDGKLFLTTVTNAPAIDHIYLFRNAHEIRDIIYKAGFNIENEICVYSEDMPPEKAEKLQISMMYAALLSPIP